MTFRDRAALVPALLCLFAVNSIAQTLTESMDLSDSLHRTLRQMAELFNLDAT